MQVLVISKNELSGPIFDMSGLQDMRWLALDNNTKLTGDVTVALNSMTKSRLIYIDDTKLKGTIDGNFLRASVNVSEIDLSRCSFRGSIPTHLLELPQLEVLDLQGNSLRGGFPAVTKWSSSLQYLSLAESGLNGTIPDAIRNLTQLVHLDLSRNALTGNFPDLSNLTQLQRLYLSENRFGRGPIPSLEQLTALTELSLKNTSRSGTIPSSLGVLSDLIMLDLGENNLNETIPFEIGKLSNLEFLLLNRNEELQGELPESFSQLSRLRLVLLDRTTLNGSVDVLCGLPAFVKTSENANRTGIISADCGDGSGTAEVTCTCCQRCCSDSDPIDCEGFDEIPTLDLEWQYRYQRQSFDFGGSAFFNDQSYLSQSP
jgi:Leucine-rich repeat (LRR) protein